MHILILSFLVTILDQVTKSLAQERLMSRGSYPVIPGFFNLTYVENTGAAWGVFQGQGLMLVGLSIVMLFILVVCRRHFLDKRLLTHLATGLMGGGIVGNLIDRLRLGYVVDYLDFNFFGWAFPAFNVADVAICVGVGTYILLQVGHPKNDAGRVADGGGERAGRA